MKTSVKIDGKTLSFVHHDGTPATNMITVMENSENGEIVFFEIKDIIRPKLEGKQKYKRVIIQRVFPCMKIDEDMGQVYE